MSNTSGIDVCGHGFSVQRDSAIHSTSMGGPGAGGYPPGGGGGGGLMPGCPNLGGGGAMGAAATGAADGLLSTMRVARPPKYRPCSSGAPSRCSCWTPVSACINNNTNIQVSDSSIGAHGASCDVVLYAISK